jgi:hypothetical protein
MAQAYYLVVNSRRYLSVFVALMVVGTVAYARRRAALPCARPIQYSVGTVDPRFGVTTEALKHDANAATAIWNQAAGRELFSYDPTSSLKVNLVYDTRQKHVAVGAALDAEDAEHQAARKVLDALQYQVIEQQDSYNSDLRALTVRGGITPDERQAFETRRAAIQSLSDSLRRGVMAFNDSNAALRSKVDRFNEDAGKTFTAGRFVRDSTGERIDVFRFTSDTELIRLLAHELGHALGLDHNDDSTSIMYMMDERGNLTASEADLRSLRKLCGM